MNGLMDPSWGNWEDDTTGSGTTNVDANFNLTVTAGVGDIAYKRLSHIATAGDLVEIKVEARLTAVDTPTAGIYIDWPVKGTLATKVEVDSDQWKSYTLRFTVPMTHDQTTDSVQFVCGSITNDDSSAEYRNPRVKVENGLTARIWACGLIKVDTSGVTSLIMSSPNVNVLGHSYSAPDLTITVPPVVAGTGNDPTPLAYMTTAAPIDYFCKTAADITGGTNGQFNIKLYDVNAGAYLAGNPSADTTVYFEVKY